MKDSQIFSCYLGTGSEVEKSHTPHDEAERKNDFVNWPPPNSLMRRNQESRSCDEIISYDARLTNEETYG